MSIRDTLVLYLGNNGRVSSLTASGGNVLLTTSAHRLDGPEHTAPIGTRTDLNATMSSPGLMPVLSGDPDDLFRGDGSQAPEADPVAGPLILAHLADATDAHEASATGFDPTGLTHTTATDVQTAIADLDGAVTGGSALTIKDEGTPLATDATSIDFVGVGVVASGSGAAKTVTVAPNVEDLPTAETDIDLVLAPDGAGGLVFRAEASPAADFLTKVDGEGHTIDTHGSLGASATLDLATGNVQSGTLNANCAIALDGWPASGVRGIMQARLTEDGTGGHVPTFSVVGGGSLVWIGGSAPAQDTAPNSRSEYIFWSDDGGTTVYGGLVGAPTLAPTVLILPGATGPAQTAEGSVVWDTDDDVLTIGTGAARKTFGYFGSTVPGNTPGSASNGSGNEAARANHDHGVSGGGGGATVATVDATLSGDVTMTTANTFYDGPSGSFAAGLWLIRYKALFALATTGNTHDVTIKLWDGTTIYDESANGLQVNNTSGTIGFEVNGVALVTLGSTTTLKISATDIRANTVMKRDVTSNSGSTHTATRLIGYKVT